MKSIPIPSMYNLVVTPTILTRSSSSRNESAFMLTKAVCQSKASYDHIDESPTMMQYIKHSFPIQVVSKSGQNAPELLIQFFILHDWSSHCRSLKDISAFKDVYDSLFSLERASSFGCKQLSFGCKHPLSSTSSSSSSFLPQGPMLPIRMVS